LKFLLEKFNGNVDLSLAAYNAGENLVARLGRIPSNSETTNYVKKIRAIYPKNAVSLTVPEAYSAQAPQPEPQPIFRSVDQRGVIHFSNVEPPR
jgi:soluble lytic murein transglycosylase-like protein